MMTMTRHSCISSSLPSCSSDLSTPTTSGGTGSFPHERGHIVNEQNSEEGVMSSKRDGSWLEGVKIVFWVIVILMLLGLVPWQHFA